VNGYTQPFWQHARSSGYTHYTLQVLKHSDNCLRVHTTQHCGTHRCVSTQRCDSGTVVEKSFSNQRVASSISCRSVLEQDTEPLIAPDVQCAISVNVKCKMCIHCKSHIC